MQFNKLTEKCHASAGEQAAWKPFSNSSFLLTLFDCSCLQLGCQVKKLNNGE